MEFKINFINWEIGLFAAFYGNLEPIIRYTAKEMDKYNILDNI